MWATCVDLGPNLCLRTCATDQDCDRDDADRCLELVDGRRVCWWL